MRKIVFIFAALLSANFVSGCHNENDPGNPILGVWVVEKYDYIANESYINFRRVVKFEENKPGYQFITNGTLVSHQIAAWCAIPPFTYDKMPGDWSMKKNTLKLKVQSWGGTSEKKYVITKLTANTLQIKQVD